MTVLYIRSLAIMAFCTPGIAMADPQSECSIDATSQVEIGNCLEAAERTADATVAMALKFALDTAKELDDVTDRESSVPALAASQTGWQSYKDQHCEFVGTTYGGGSGTGIAIRSCRVALARARSDELMRYAQ